MDCSMPDFPVLHHLLELAQTHVHWISDTIQPSCPHRPLLLLPSICPSIRLFLMSWLFTSGGQSIEASVSASVPPMNIQDRFPLGWTGWISLQSKGLSRVFSNTTVWKHQFFGPQPSLWANTHIHTWLLEKPRSSWSTFNIEFCLSIRQEEPFSGYSRLLSGLESWLRPQCHEEFMWLPRCVLWAWYPPCEPHGQWPSLGQDWIWFSEPCAQGWHHSKRIPCHPKQAAQVMAELLF